MMEAFFFEIKMMEALISRDTCSPKNNYPSRLLNRLIHVYVQIYLKRTTYVKFDVSDHRNKTPKRMAAYEERRGCRFLFFLTLLLFSSKKQVLGPAE
jgi:hypothetical protein